MVPVVPPFTIPPFTTAIPLLAKLARFPVPPRALIVRTPLPVISTVEAFTVIPEKEKLLGDACVLASNVRLPFSVFKLDDVVKYTYIEVVTLIALEPVKLLLPLKYTAPGVLSRVMLKLSV